jgi:sugar phosphate isomerase/epimerase
MIKGDLHPRVIVNEISLPRDAPLDVHVEQWESAGIRRVGVIGPKLMDAGVTEGIELLQRSGLEVAYLMHPALFQVDARAGWPAQVEAIEATIDVAVAVGANRIYGTTGAGGSMIWEEAAAAFVEAYAGIRPYAEKRGVEMLIETNNPQFADLGFVHAVAELVELVERAGLGVCLDLHASWTERGLRSTIERHIGLVGLVQVADYVPGTRNLDRDVPGDGIIPIERLLDWVLEAGYTGDFDIELYSLRQDGHLEAMRRSVEELSSLLERLGA